MQREEEFDSDHDLDAGINDSDSEGYDNDHDVDSDNGGGTQVEIARGKRRLQNVSAKTWRKKVMLWMKKEVETCMTDTKIASKVVKQFLEFSTQM